MKLKVSNIIYVSEKNQFPPLQTYNEKEWEAKEKKIGMNWVDHSFDEEKKYGFVLS